MLGSTFTKFLSFLKQKIGFSSNFAPLFNIMRQLLHKQPAKVKIWWNFAWAVKSLKFCTVVDSFCKNRIKFQLKKYRRLISHGIEEWWKLKKTRTYGFKFDMRNLVNFHPATQKSRHLTLMGYVCPKYMRFELKKYWTEMQNWHKEFG